MSLLQRPTEQRASKSPAKSCDMYPDAVVAENTYRNKYANATTQTIEKSEHENSVSAEQFILTPLTPMTPLNGHTLDDVNDTDDENECNVKHVQQKDDRDLTAHTLTPTDFGHEEEEEEEEEEEDNDNLPKKVRRSFSHSSSHSHTPKKKYLSNQQRAQSDPTRHCFKYPEEYKHDYLEDSLDEEGKKARRSQSFSFDESHDSRDQLVLENLTKYRQLKGVIYGNLDKFQGDDVQKMHIIKRNHKTKFVVYVPQKQLLFYSKSDDPNDTTTMVSVKAIETNNPAINAQLPVEYQGKYFRVIGHTRSVLFALWRRQEIQRWIEAIRASLSVRMQLIEPYITLRDQYYIDGWLQKYQGSKKDNIKFQKGSSHKYVIFIPTLKMLYFCGEKKNKVKITMMKVRRVTRKNVYIHDRIGQKRRDKWFKVIGINRLVLFVAESMEERDIWFKHISQSLSLHQHELSPEAQNL